MNHPPDASISRMREPPDPQRIAISGSSGLVGTALRFRLKDLGHEAIPIVRRVPTAGEIGWSESEQRLEEGAFNDVDAVVHLAGAPIAGWRWTKKYKHELLRSRTKGTAMIAKAIGEASTPPRVLLSASAIGIYGSSFEDSFDENSALGDGFLSQLCQAWEAEAALESSSTRVVYLRTGIVLSADGGMLGKLIPLYKMGLGGRVGSGRQWVSWVHIEDQVEAIIHLLSSGLEGPVNVCSPNPVQYEELNTTLGKVLNRPSRLPIPSFGPRLLLGSELAENLLFTGQHVSPNRLAADRYQFRHPHLEGALREIAAR